MTSTWTYCNRPDERCRRRRMDSGHPYLQLRVDPGGFTPRFHGLTQQFFATVGYKGTTGFGMDYDFSGSGHASNTTRCYERLDQSIPRANLTNELL